MPHEIDSISSRRMATGITAFDEMSAGGLPRRGVTVVLGAARAGKTTVGLQVLANGAPFLQKPFTPDGLMRVVREVLDGRPS